ncbi:MAG: hypothetical protein Kow0049_11850 [Stanieria sp.]
MQTRKQEINFIHDILLETTMSKPNDSRRSSIPYWQLTQMKMIIRERWGEVWEVVEARDKFRTNLH